MEYEEHLKPREKLLAYGAPVLTDVEFAEQKDNLHANSKESTSCFEIGVSDSNIQSEQLSAPTPKPCLPLS